MDPNRAQDIAQWLSGELGILVVARSQANSFAADDYEAFTEALRDGKLSHTGDLGLRRHVLAATRARLPGDKFRFDRPRKLRKQADRRKILIDALQAAAMLNSHMKIGLPAAPSWRPLDVAV
jgi:hypothetical protein